MWIIWSINKWVMICYSRRLKAERMFHKNKISLGEEQKANSHSSLSFRTEWCYTTCVCRVGQGPLLPFLLRTIYKEVSMVLFEKLFVFKTGNRYWENGSSSSTPPTLCKWQPYISCELKFMAWELISLNSTQITDA